MALQRIAAATLMCVSLADVKAQCRVDVADDDALLTAMILAATDEAEHLMRRAVLTQQWRLTLDSFFDQAGAALNSGNVIELRPVSVASVESVKYVDTAGVLQTLPNTEYQTSLGSQLHARLAPAYGKSWPSTRGQMDAVQVDFTCGWAAAANVPPAIKQWVLMRVAAYYDNREAWTLGQPIQRNAFIDRLLDRWRVPTF